MYVSEDTFVHLRQAADERQLRELEYRRIARERGADTHVDRRARPAAARAADPPPGAPGAEAALAPVTAPHAGPLHIAIEPRSAVSHCRRTVGR